MILLVFIDMKISYFICKNKFGEFVEFSSVFTFYNHFSMVNCNKE